MAAPPPPSNNANFHVGGVGVPGAQVEILENMQPEKHILEQAHQPQSLPQPQQPQPQQQYYQQPHQSQQFEQQYQQSFFTQPNTTEMSATANAIQQQMAPPTTVPLNTNTIGDGFPGYSVGGVGVPGAKVELMPLVQPGQDAALEGQLDTVQHVSALRPPVGPFDPPAPTATTAPIPLLQSESFSQNAGPPMIQIDRQASMLQQQQQQQQLYQQLQQQQQLYQQQHLQQQHLQQPFGSASISPFSVSPSVSPPLSPKIHIASENAIAAAAAGRAADASTRGRRRSSFALLADKFRSASRSRSPSLSRRLSRTLSRHSDDGDEDYEAAGPYADVKLAQREHLSKLRAEQARNNVTTNVDGLPIPPPPESQSRRSSISHLLGLDKPWLSR